jgi:hypothetical protein
MIEQTTPAALSRTFTEAWTSGRIDAAANYVAEGVIFDGPLGHVEGKVAYLESLERLARNLGVTSARVVAAFGDAEQALIMYELLTDRYGVLLCAKLVTFRDGLIQRDRLTFDSAPIRGS